MRIDLLELVNFKAFEQFRLALHPEFNLIVGVNGTGKTSLLDALSIAAGSWFLGLRGYDTRHISHDEARLAMHDFDGEIRFEAQYPVRVKAQGEVNGQLIDWERSLESPAGKTHFRHANRIKALATECDQAVRDGREVTLPLISYYGTGRLWREPRAESQLNQSMRAFGLTRNPHRHNSRLDGYLHSVTPRLSTRELVTWMSNQSWASYQQGKETPVFTAVKRAMVGCLEGAEKLYFDPKRGEIVVVMAQQRGTQPFDNLSDGQRCMLAMVGDIAQKAVRLNPHFGDRVLEQTPGVVLIDELDLHLHPRWQRRVIADLRRTFPRIQFICTTHSPQLIGQAKADEVILLGGDAPTHPDQTFGMDSNWVLRHVMDSTDRDAGVSAELDALFELIEQGEVEQAQAKIDRLRTRIGEHPELVEAQALVTRYTRWPESR